MHILRCMGSKFCVKFQRAPLKFHTIFWTHTPQNIYFTVLYFCVWVTISLNYDVINLSETGPWWYIESAHQQLWYWLSYPKYSGINQRALKKKSQKEQLWKGINGVSWYSFLLIVLSYIKSTQAHSTIAVLGCLALLTLNVPGPSYLGLTRSISWLLMPWLLTSPCHP